MAELVWGNLGDRVYEAGLDKGVLYLPDGSAVPWNGLISVVEHFQTETSPVYYDGMKISDLVALGSFSATMSAITYPDEFLELEGLAQAKTSIFFADQTPQTFALCYRTQIGNALVGENAGHKLHILYNLTAVPSDKTYATLSADPALAPFQWEITAVPEEIPGFRPTAHIVIDSTKEDPLLLEALEAMLYGTESSDPELMALPDLADYILNWYRIQITDNGDGTWTATSVLDESIVVDGVTQEFIILDVNAVYLDADTYEVSDT